MQIQFYLIKNKKVVPVDKEEYRKFLIETGGIHIVGNTQVGPYTVSTIFLHMDVGFFGKKQFFETAISPMSAAVGDYIRRCATYADAEHMHAEAVRLITDQYEQEGKEKLNSRDHCEVCAKQRLDCKC